MSASVPPPPQPGDDDGRAARGRDEPFQDLPDVHVLVPDDLSELSDEVAAYRREVRRSARRARVRRFLPTRRLRRYGLSGPVVVLTLLIVAGLGALLTVFAPRVRGTVVRTRPLATTAAAAGTVGGLLIDTTLKAGGRPFAARAMRPAVVVLLPVNCNCGRLVQQIAHQTVETPGLVPYLVAPAADESELADLTAAAATEIGQVVDPDSALARAYHADAKAPTLLLVGGDGVLLAPPRVFHDNDRLEGWIDPLRPVTA